MAEQRGRLPEESRDVTVVFLLIVAILIVVPLLFMGGMMGPGMMGWRAPGWGWSPFLLLLLLAGVIALLLLGARRPTPPDDPMAVLKLRLARGEITMQQFEELKRALQQDAGAPISGGGR